MNKLATFIAQAMARIDQAHDLVTKLHTAWTQFYGFLEAVRTKSNETVVDTIPEPGQTPPVYVPAPAVTL